MRIQCVPGPSFSFPHEACASPYAGKRGTGDEATKDSNSLLSDCNLIITVEHNYSIKCRTDYFLFAIIVHLSFICRDIPMPLVTSGVEYGNLRERCLIRMKEFGSSCRDIRTREVGIQEIHKKIQPYEVCLSISRIILFIFLV